MRKVTVRLPATMTCIGPGVRALGLALELYTTVEITERSDRQLIVDTAGEGAGHYSIGLRHPVTLALMRIFQHMERSPRGVHIRITNAVPVASGLGAEAAFWVAGIIGANNLLGRALSREAILQLSVHLCPQPDNAVSALLGGLSSGIMDGDRLIYRTLPVSPFSLVVVVPQIDEYPASMTPLETVPWGDALYNLSRIPLLLEGFRTGDLSLVARMLGDRLVHPRIQSRIPGYNHVRETARLAGALGITISGHGPALVAFAEAHHAQIGEAMIAAFGNAGVKARAWVVPVDRQGVVISAVQSG